MILLLVISLMALSRESTAWNNVPGFAARMLIAQALTSSVSSVDDIILLNTKNDKNLGIILQEANYKGSLRTRIKSIKTDTAPRAVVETVRPGMIISSVNGKNVEGLSARRVATLIKNFTPSSDLIISFRDSAIFLNALDSRRAQSPAVVTTTVLPGHVLKIERLERGGTGGQSSAKVAEAGDVLEVSFQLRFKDSGELIDGVSSVEAAGSPTIEKNMFFVLGSGRYDNPLLGSSNDDILPPGWDQYLYGMVVDELRRISIPPSLGVDAVGFDPHLS